MNHTTNFKFSCTHIKKNNCNNTFNLTQHIPIIIFYHFNVSSLYKLSQSDFTSIYLFTYLSYWVSPKFRMHFALTEHFITSAIKQVLNSHMWKLANILGTAALYCELLDFIYCALFIYLSSFLPSLYFREIVNNLDLPILIPVFTLILHILYLMAKYHFPLTSC